MRAHGAPQSGAIFLDRDGTLNRSAAPGEYIRRPEDLGLLPGAADAIRRINTAGIRAILVTNQRWLSEPMANIDAYAAVESQLSRLLAANGARIDACYTCPHPANSCGCRKPTPGMLQYAADDLDISLRDSFVIGDSFTDVLAGLAVSATTVLIDPNCHYYVGPQAAHFVARNIGEAVDWVLDAARHTFNGGQMHRFERAEY